MASKTSYILALLFAVLSIGVGSIAFVSFLVGRADLFWPLAVIGGELSLISCALGIAATLMGDDSKGGR